MKTPKCWALFSTPFPPLRNPHPVLNAQEEEILHEHRHHQEPLPEEQAMDPGSPPPGDGVPLGLAAALTALANAIKNLPGAPPAGAVPPAAAAGPVLDPYAADQPLDLSSPAGSAASKPCCLGCHVEWLSRAIPFLSRGSSHSILPW